MKAFSQLFTEIDQTTSTNEKTDALVRYFETVDGRDAIWCVALLTGRRPRRAVKTGELRDWTSELTGTPTWLLEESYHVVGDLAETITLLLPDATQAAKDLPLHLVMQQLLQLADADEATRKTVITGFWSRLSKDELFVFNKLITGGFRMGVSEKIIIKALAKRYQVDENVAAHRLTGKWEAQGNNLEALFTLSDISSDISRPYPFYLAYPLESSPGDLGNVGDWMIERKYDGIRGQIIVRDSQLFVWSRGEDLMTEKFVEFHTLVNMLPNGTVIDGEILPVKDGQLLPFHVMQTRIGRKNVTKKTLQEAPLAMICYDLLEHDGVDIRHLSMAERRQMLETLLQRVQMRFPGNPLLQLSPLVHCDSWEAVAAERLVSREQNCEGLMLKLKSSEYKTGRRRGEWWKWKTDPYTIDGVMVYAQRGHGRRANLYTDFTFAVWDGDQLVPFTKAYSGLTDKELLEVDSWIKKNTLDKFGPVRTVVPQQVFELGFEGINPSSRHKSGVALRFPRILRWRRDKPASEANTKADLLALLQAAG